MQRNLFNSKEREEDGPPLSPFAIVEYDIYGLINVCDPNGFRFLIVLICTATGGAFGKPLRAKSEAVQALRAFAKWHRLRAEVIAVKMQLAQPLHLGLLRSGRYGAFTTKWGARRTLLDEEAYKVFLEQYFSSKDSPRTATTKVERFWRNLCDATGAAMLASGIGQCYSFYATRFVVQV